MKKIVIPVAILAVALIAIIVYTSQTGEPIEEQAQPSAVIAPVETPIENEPTPEVETETEITETTPEVEPETEVEITPEIEPTPEVEPETEAEMTPEVEPIPEITPEPEVEATPTPQVEETTQPTPETEPEPVVPPMTPKPDTKPEEGYNAFENDPNYVPPIQLPDDPHADKQDIGGNWQ